MPFKSEKQRKWMWANDPEMARKWEEEEKKLTSEESVNEEISFINKSRAKSSLKQIEQGYRDDGFGKFDSKVFAIKDDKEIELKKLSDLNKYSTGYKYGLKKSINEALKPEVSEKAKEIFKTMIGDRRDKLMKRYGKDAEKVAYGRAIAQAKKQLDKPEEEMKDEKLKEMVKAALMNPITEKGKDLDGDGDIDSQDYLKARDIAIKKRLQKEGTDDVSKMMQGHGKTKEEADRIVKGLKGEGDNINSIILKYLKSETDPTDESKPFDIDKLVNVKKTDRGNYEVYYLTNSGKKEGILVYQYEIDKMKKKKKNLEENQSDKISGMLEILKKYGYDDYKLNKRFLESYSIKQALEVIRQLSGTNINENSLLKEYTMHGGDYRDSYANRPPEEQLTTPEHYEEFEDILPKGADSRILISPDRKQDFDKHVDWTKQSDYNNTFVHVQYHELEHDGNDYFVHQTQYYNHNYDDFRSPDVTKLYIVKNRDTEDEEKLGTYLVDTSEYVKDLKNLNVKKRVSEGTCGYSIDGEGDNKPAGSHLLEKKIKEIIRKKLGKAPKAKDMMYTKKMKTPSGLAFYSDFDINEIIKNMKEDVVKGSNIKKVGDDWRILSGKTGKMWKAKYDTKEDAEAALRGYFASQNESLVESILAKLRK